MTESIVTIDCTTSVFICRSCSSSTTEGKMKPLSTKLSIDPSIFEIPPNTSVLDLLVYCTKLPIELDDAMPQTVCTVCIKKLLATYEFLSDCEATEAKLREYAAVAAKVKDFVDEVNFDDIIIMDIKPKDEQLLLSGSEIEEIASEIETKVDVESLTVYEYLVDPSSPVVVEAPDEEYLDQEYLVEAETQQKDYDEQNEDTMATNLQPKVGIDPIVHPPAGKILRCKVEGCGEAFYLAKLLRAHQAEVHTKSFLCPVCGINCTTRRRLYEHERTHNGFNEKSKRRADCEVCGQSITVKDMKSHLRRHTGERPYSCNTCGKTFRQCSTMRTHELMHLKERPFPCKICDKTFARAAILKIHHRTHTGEKPFACAMCPNKYARRHLLANHERTHTGSRPYECEICKKGFKNVAIMKEHRYVHIANQQMCGECPAVFTFPRLLRKHMREQHPETDC